MVESIDLEHLRAVKAEYESDLLRKPNVVGVGIGLRHRDGEPSQEPAIVVSVTHKVPSYELAPEDVIPRELEGVPVDVQVVGELRAF
jgi:hypothetical protein